MGNLPLHLRRIHKTFVPTLSPNAMIRSQPLFQYLTIGGLLIGTSGCASLTETQRKTVADYAKLTQVYAQYPSQIAASYADLNYAIEQVRLATPVQPDLINSGMWQSYTDRDDVLQEAQRVDVGIKAVKAYAQALEALSSATIPTGFSKNADLLGTNLDAVVKTYNRQGGGSTPLPLGFGALAAQVISAAGKGYINHRQAKALREFMGQGDVLLRAITTDMQTAIRTFRQDRANSLKSNLGAYHTKLLSQLTLQTPGRPYYIYEINKDVAQLINRIVILDNLTIGVQNSVVTLYEAHHSVLEDIQQKRSLRQQVADLKALFQSAKSIDEQYQALINANRPKP